MISIILPTKNGERFISKAIESVISQSEKDFELIVVMDGSTDSTKTIVESFANQDKRIKLLSNERSIGTGRTRDTGIKNSNGKYVALIDDDDEWLDINKLSTQKKFLDDHPDYMLIGAERVKEIDEQGKLIGHYNNPLTDNEIRALMLRKACFITSSVMFRKSSYEKVGGFRDIYRAEDYDLWLRLGKIGKMANLKGCEIYYRIRKHGPNPIKEKEWYKAIVRAIKENKNEYPGFVPAIIRAYSRFVYLEIFGRLNNPWINEKIRKIMRIRFR